MCIKENRCPLIIRGMYTSSANEREYLSWLTKNERDIWVSKRARRNKFGWLSSRIATKKAIIDWLKTDVGRDIPPCEVNIVSDLFGKPYIMWSLDIKPPEISISHIGDYGFAVVSPHMLQVGCDIEAITSFPLNTIGYFTSETEIENCKSTTVYSGCIDTILTLLWSTKEAAIKSLSLINRNEQLMPYDVVISMQTSLGLNNIGNYTFTYKNFNGSGAWAIYKNYILCACLLNTSITNRRGIK